MLWSVGTSESQLLVQKEGLEDGVGGKSEDGKECVGNQERDDADDDDWPDWGGHFEVVGVHEDHVGDQSVGGCDGENSEVVENGSNS